MEAGAVPPPGVGVALRLRPIGSGWGEEEEEEEVREGKERGASSRERRSGEEPSTRLSSLQGAGWLQL
jgi:hypothetical protein